MQLTASLVSLRASIHPSAQQLILCVQAISNMFTLRNAQHVTVMWLNVEQSDLAHSAVPVLVYTHSEANSQSHNQPRCLARTGLTSSHPECKLHDS